MKRIVILLQFFISLTALAGTWIQKPSFGGVGRHRGTGVAIFNKGYIGLGHVNGTGIDISYKDWWEYDPASASWTQKADFPVTNHGAIAFSVGKKGYVGGGSYLNGEFYCYDPQTNNWTPISPCPLNAQDQQAFSVGNKGYVYMFSEIVEYDPQLNVWTPKADAPVSFSSWSSSFSIGSSGFIKSGMSFLEFKPAQNAWVTRTQFPGLMSNGSAAFAIENKGFLTSGYYGGLSNVIDEVWSFDPGSNAWTYEGEFPGTSRRFPVAFAIGNKGYFGTGTNGVNLNDFWEFDTRNLGLTDLEINMEVYPNPGTDHIMIQMDEEKFSLLKKPVFLLIDRTGRIVRSHPCQNAEFRIERDGLPAGFYFFHLQAGGKVVLTKALIFK